jgi:hypothetical protein
MHITREADGDRAESLFAVVLEPYAGEPFITDVAFEGNPKEAEGYAAIRVRTKNGANDLIFSDAVNPHLRTLKEGVAVDGRFAFVSRDETGLRHANLVGGRRLALPDLVIETDTAEHEARVIGLDYLNNCAMLDRHLPAVLADRFFVAGTPSDGTRGARWSNFEATRIEGDTLIWRKGADGGTGIIDVMEPMSEILADEKKAGPWRARGAKSDDLLLTLRMPSGMPDGRNRQVALSCGPDGALVSADIFGQQILLRAEDAQKLGLKADDRVRFYEIAIGDIFRTSSQVSFSRREDGVYSLRTDVPCRVMIRGKTGKSSADGGRTWLALTQTENDMLRIEVKTAGDILLRADK